MIFLFGQMFAKATAVRTLDIHVDNVCVVSLVETECLEQTGTYSSLSGSMASPLCDAGLF